MVCCYKIMHSFKVGFTLCPYCSKLCNRWHNATSMGIRLCIEYSKKLWYNSLTLK
jgi:hypothetical protein